MTFKIKRLWALLMALAMLVGVAGTALAKETYSKPVDLNGRIVRPQPTPDDADEGQIPEQPGEPSTEPGTEPGADPGTDPGADPGTDPGIDPDTDEPGEPEQPETPAEPEYEVVTEQEDGKVNLRRTPEIAEDNIITSIPRGARLTVLERAGDWVKVTYNGQEGYVNARFVTEMPAEAEQPDEPEEEPTEVPFESKYQRDGDGNLILDENGNPVPLEPMEGEVQYKRDADGNLELDENGEPVVVIEEEPVEQKILIFADRDPSGLVPGDVLTLSAQLIGFEDADYTLNWQVKREGGEWQNIDGATGMTLTIEIEEEHDGCAWRLQASANG